MAVLGVQDGGGHGEVPVEADGYQVEYGGGAAGDVHGKEEVTDTIWKVPVTPVGLKATPFIVFLHISFYF